MRGVLCFTSLMVLWAGIETLPIWADVVLLIVFWLTSMKYWTK